MEDLVKLIQQKVGISPEQAKSAINTVAGFLRERLPAPLAGQVESVLSGGGGGIGEGLGDLAKGIGGMMGGKEKS
jgi:hypothetical protein